MKTYTREELALIIEKHIKWVRSEEGGKRADLRGAYLQGAYLRRADLQRADLQGAYLQRADLQGADLRGAYLQRADLQGADLQRADLQGAYLQRADLQGADLRRADLQGAYLQGADLQRADLQGAYLQGAKTKETYFEPQSRYHVMHREDGMIKIGCKEKTIQEWDDWFDGDEQYETKRGTDDFKCIHAHYLAVRAYVMAMKE